MWVMTQITELGKYHLCEAYAYPAQMCFCERDFNSHIIKNILGMRLGHSSYWASRWVVTGD